MEHFKLKLDRTSIEHRWTSINVHSLLPTNCVTKETISQSANSKYFRAKMRDTPIFFPVLTILYLVSSCLYFHVKWRKGRHFICEDCRFVCFEPPSELSSKFMRFYLFIYVATARIKVIFEYFAIRIRRMWEIYCKPIWPWHRHFVWRLWSNICNFHLA